MRAHTTLKLSLRLTTATIAVSLVALPAMATSLFTAPTDLNPGDPYRLIFQTNGNYAATSSDITTYDAVVTASAGNNSSLPTTTWRALVSTPTVNAVDHLACLGTCASAPIYNLRGERVANSLAALMSVGFPNTVFDAPIVGVPTDERNFDSYNYVWSGSTNAGIGVPGYELGAALVDGNDVPRSQYGWGNYYGPTGWLNLGSSSDQTGSLAFYAISGDYPAITATTETPEPLSAAVLAAGLGALAAARRRRAARA